MELILIKYCCDINYVKYFFYYYISWQKMEVNNRDQIIYPQNLRKFTGSIQGVRSKAKEGNKIVSFRVLIKTANFLYQKNFPSRVEAEFELI